MQKNAYCRETVGRPDKTYQARLRAMGDIVPTLVGHGSGDASPGRALCRTSLSLAIEGQTHLSALCRRNDCCLSSLSFLDRRVCQQERRIWRRFFLLTHELDQAEFLVDDVSIWMGYKGRSRDHPWPSLASSLLRQPTCSRDCFKLGSIRPSHQRRMQSQSPVPTCDCSGIPIITRLANRFLRRAIQLGLRGAALDAFGRRELSRSSI